MNKKKDLKIIQPSPLKSKALCLYFYYRIFILHLNKERLILQMKASSMRTLSYFCQLFISWMATQCFVYSRGSIDIYGIGKPVLNIVSLHYKGGRTHPIWNLSRPGGSERYRSYGESKDTPEVSLGCEHWDGTEPPERMHTPRQERAERSWDAAVDWSPVAAEWTGWAPRQAPPISVALTSDLRHREMAGELQPPAAHSEGAHFPGLPRKGVQGRASQCAPLHWQERKKEVRGQI